MPKKSLIPATLVALTLAACGSTTQGAPKVQAPQKASTGFYNMTMLAQSFTEQYNTGDWSTGAYHVKDVSCFLTAPQTAACHGDAYDESGDGPQGVSVTVDISTDGQQWISQ